MIQAAEIIRFLNAIIKADEAGYLATRHFLPAATREQDRARKLCTKRGLAKWRYGHWEITEKGRELANASQERLP